MLLRDLLAIVDDDGFEVGWDNGSVTSTCKTGLKTELILLCDESNKAKWSGQNQTKNFNALHKDSTGCGVS